MMLRPAFLVPATLAAMVACTPGVGRGPTVTPASAMIDASSDPAIGGASVASVPGVSARAMRVYRRAFVIDMHNDMPSKMADERYDADVRHPAGFDAPRSGHTDLPRLMESGLTAEFMSAFVDAPYARMTPDSSFARAVLLCDSVHAFAGRHPDRLLFATTAADIRRAKREGKVAIFIGVEGGHAIENSLDRLRELHRRGARYLTLTWNNGNDWAGSSVGVEGTRTGGLTDFGRRVVHEMNRLGMLVDLSHVSDSTFFDAVAASTVPVIASHSSARALNDVPRNLTDAQLVALARNGGVANVNFFSRFLDPGYRKVWAEGEAHVADVRASAQARFAGDTIRIRAAVQAARDSANARLPQTPLSTLIDHMDHIAKVAGVDHVGIGSDFDGVSALPAGMDDVTMLPRIAQGLLDRGYSESDVEKMLGGNMLRVIEEVVDRAAAAGAR